MIPLFIVAILVALLFVVGVAVLSFAMRPAEFELKGKHVFITGGSSGIGLAVARLCAREGAHVTIAARDAQKLALAKELVDAARLDKYKQQVTITSADICKPNEVKRAFAWGKQRAGCDIDVLICSAGASIPAAFEDIDLESFDQLMTLNWLGCVACIKECLPGMRARGGGRIVLISSQAGQVGVYGFTAYASTKFALRGLAESLQMEVARDNIRVSLCHPPDTDTPSLKRENERKPEETKLISASSGLFKPTRVAKDIMRGMRRGYFNVYTGFEGWMLSTLTAGMSPEQSIWATFVQGCFMGIMRLIALVYLRSFYRIVARTAKQKRDAEKQE